MTIDRSRGGWTAGAGIESPLKLFASLLGPNWTAKTEYLYVDLGNTTNAFTVVGTPQTFHDPDDRAHLPRRHQLPLQRAGPGGGVGEVLIARHTRALQNPGLSAGVFVYRAPRTGRRRCHRNQARHRLAALVTG